MIPYLALESNTPQSTKAFFERLRLSGYLGDIEDSVASLHRTDKCDVRRRPMGIDLQSPGSESDGCRGRVLRMAGTFGHETRNRELSERIFDLSWRKRLERHESGDVFMATGYSCRSQVKLMESQPIKHPLQVLKTLVCEDRPSLARKWHDM
jgi:hypothetical protein